MKLFNNTTILLILALSSSAQNLNVENKWKLFGAIEDIESSVFDTECVEYVWKYNNTWSSYSSNKKNFNSIASGEGFWLKGNSSCTITTEKSNIFNAKQKQIANQIISVFENNTPTIQYDYAENLFDGRGITAGRAGFTSATADMLEVVKRYTTIVPNNPLAVYLPRLEELAKNEDDSVIGLDGLESAWKKSANDEIFKSVQDEIVDEWYYVPSTIHAKTLGAVLPLTLLNLYDAIIQHGDGDDPDGLLAMINQTSSYVGGTIKDGIDEHVWLKKFMDIRRSVLLNPYNKETKEEWSKSVGRIDTLKKLYDSGNFYLISPIVINTWGDVFTININ